VKKSPAHWGRQLASHRFVIPVAVTLIAFALRVYRLNVQSLWWDETYVATISRLPDWFGWVFAEERSHPPGFFLIMSLWTQLGVGEFILRFPSVIWGSLSVPIMFAIGSRFGNRNVGVLGALLLAISPYDAWYSQEARMYAPQVALALLSSYLFLRLIARADRWLTTGIALVSVAGLYLFYLFPLVLLAQLVFLILSWRRYRTAARNWLIANVLAGILFLPWFAAILATGGFARAAVAWIPPAQWYDPILSIYTLVVGTTNSPWQPFNWLAPLIFAALAGYAIWKIRSEAWRETIRYHILWLIVPFGLVFLISLPMGIPQQRSLYSDRYFLQELPALLLLVSFGAVRLQRTHYKAGVAVLTIAIVPMLISLWGMYYNPAYGRDDWRAASDYVAAIADPGHDQVALEASLTWPFSYYDRSHLARVASIPVAESFAAQLKSALASKPTSRLWLLTATIAGSAHRFSPTPEEQLKAASQDAFKKLLDARYPIESERLFQGILVTAYLVRP
jgi:mannosyltransferase